jgi:hypothetical protein
MSNRNVHAQIIGRLTGRPVGDWDQIRLLTEEGVKSWNSWRSGNHGAVPNLIGADLAGLDLAEANLLGAKLSGARLTGTNLRAAFLSEADLSGVNLDGANLFAARIGETNLSMASLRGASLNQANLFGANLSGADLSGASLQTAQLLTANLVGAHLGKSDLSFANFAGSDLKGADLSGANLMGCSLVGANLDACTLVNNCVYGISAWDIHGTPAIMTSLNVAPPGNPPVLVDDLKIAQFIYLLIDNKQIKDLIDTMTSKVVLLLGRFTPERKDVLDKVKTEIHRYGYVPVLFDFDKPASKDVTGTVETLARMARFIIADLTDPSSIPHELATLVPFLRTTPVLPIKLKGSVAFSLFDDLRRSYPWVLETYVYKDCESLISSLPMVIQPADKKAEEFRNNAREY